jgi:hypothetical protein
MKKVLLSMFLILCLAFPVYAANQYGCTALTGEGAGALDALDITGVSSPNVDNLAEGDIAKVDTISGTTVNHYVYIFDADGTSAESVPDVIRPQDYVANGPGVWRLSLSNSDVIVDLGDDGGNDTVSLDEIAITGTDTNTIYSVSGDKLTVDVDSNWPAADLASTLTISDNESTNEENAVLFTSGGDVDGGDLSIESDGDMTYNPSTGTFTATEFSGGGSAITGVDAATVDGEDAANIVTAARVGAVSASLDDTDATVEWEDAADLESDGALSVDVVSTDEMADADHGAVSWSSGTATVETVTVTDNENTNETNAVVFTSGGDVDGDPNMNLESDGTLNYNPSTGTLSTTIFSGSGESLTWADNTNLDLSSITYVNAATTNEGLALPPYVSGSAPADGKNYVAYDVDNNVLMVYEAGGWVDTSAASGASASANYLTTQAEGGLTAESVFTDGYAIDSTDAGGDGGAFTVGLDTTEVSADGSDTWSDGSQASIAWTFDVSGTDHTMTAGDGVMTFGDAVTVTDLLTASAGVTVSTGQNVTVGSTQWNSGDSIDGEQIANDTIDDDSIDLTDITLNDFTFDVGSVSKTEFGYLNNVSDAIQTQLDARALESVIGDAIEADDLELSGTTLQLTAEVPHVDAAQSWSAKQTFTDNTDVQFGTAGEYAIGTWDTDISDDDDDFDTAYTGEGLVFTFNDSSDDAKVIFNNSDGTYGVDLIVKDIIYSGAISPDPSSTADSYLELKNNSSFAGSGYQIFAEGGTWYLTEGSATEERILTHTDSIAMDAAATSVDFSAVTNFEVPNGADPTTDAFGEIAADNNAWDTGRGAVEFYDGTASTFLVGALASDSPSDGQVPKWNTGGTITWENDADSGGAPEWQNVTDPTADATIDHDIRGGNQLYLYWCVYHRLPVSH